MNALILCGGKGTRLRPLTYFVPKPMVKINGVPVVELIYSYLYRFGIRDIFMNVHYKYNNIIRHFADNALFFYESELSGEDGAIQKLINVHPNIAKDYLVVVNGDTLTNLDLTEMYRMSEGKSIQGWDKVYTGIKILSPSYLSGKDKEICKYSADFWWCDIGTWDGLKRAKKEYAKATNSLWQLPDARN